MSSLPSDVVEMSPRDRTALLTAEATAIVEDWSPTLRVHSSPTLSAVDTGDDVTPDAVRKAASVMLLKKAKGLEPGTKFEFKSTRLVHHDAERLSPAIFYELGDGSGWVHDYNLRYPGQRCIKVNLVHFVASLSSDAICSNCKYIWSGFGREPFTDDSRTRFCQQSAHHFSSRRNDSGISTN